MNTWVFFSGINCKNDPDFPSRVKLVMLFEFTCLIISHQAYEAAFYDWIVNLSDLTRKLEIIKGNIQQVSVWSVVGNLERIF